MSEAPFHDYYEILQVSAHADSEMIERVFRVLAKRYHPDNTETGNHDRFNLISDAYQVLSDPEERAAYDVTYAQGRERQLKIYNEASSSNPGLDEDVRVRQGVLSLLYLARRRDIDNPGMGPLELEQLLGCPEKHLEFHTWYLREKRWIQRLESGQFAITVDGVDHVNRDDVFLRPDRLLTGRSAPANPGESQTPDEGSPSSSGEASQNGTNAPGAARRADYVPD